MKILVTGAGGFIGGHLVDSLVSQGHTVYAADIKEFKDWFEINDSAMSMKADLRLREDCARARPRMRPQTRRNSSRYSEAESTNVNTCGLVVGGRRDGAGRLVHLVEREIGAAGDVQEDPARALDRRLEQG